MDDVSERNIRRSFFGKSYTKGFAGYIILKTINSYAVSNFSCQSFFTDNLIIYTLNIKNTAYILGRTTISITDETKKRFIKVKGALERKNGKSRSEDDVMNELIDLFEQREKNA